MNNQSPSFKGAVYATAIIFGFARDEEGVLLGIPEHVHWDAEKDLIRLRYAEYGFEVIIHPTKPKFNVGVMDKLGYNPSLDLLRRVECAGNAINKKIFGDKAKEGVIINV